MHVREVHFPWPHDNASQGKVVISNWGYQKPNAMVTRGKGQYSGIRVSPWTSSLLLCIS